MSVIDKLYKSMYEKELRKLRLCAESVQNYKQLDVFVQWSKEVMTYLFFKLDQIDSMSTWDYKERVVTFIHDCQEIAQNKAMLKYNLED